MHESQQITICDLPKDAVKQIAKYLLPDDVLISTPLAAAVSIFDQKIKMIVGNEQITNKFFNDSMQLHISEDTL